MTNYFNFNLSTDVEKNPGPTQSNTDSHETIILLSLSCKVTVQWCSWFALITLMHSRLHELGLQAIDDGGAGDCFFRSLSHQLYGIITHPSIFT